MRILSLIILSSILLQVQAEDVWKSGIDLTNCFLQLNGDVHCYDKRTGKKIILKTA